PGRLLGPGDHGSEQQDSGQACGQQPDGRFFGGRRAGAPGGAALGPPGSFRFGDARRKQTLIEAGVERASAIVACTSDELTNLDIGLDARELNPNIKVVLRMFDAKLAQNVSKGFNIKTVFSVSALAAPAFAAAATRTRVDYSFKLEGQLLNVSTVTFESTSPFIGKTLEQIENELQCAIIGAWSGNGIQMRPARDHVVQPGERYYVVGDLKAVRALNEGR
ncbi:MAG: hypothetical protein CUN48_15145, partial [Candidatus Thermofonsia Clade 3 bacterium]